jgi:hypothetical protein
LNATCHLKTNRLINGRLHILKKAAAEIQLNDIFLLLQPLKAVFIQTTT